MTTRIVMLKYADPTALGDVGAPNGYIECRPTRRRNVDDTVVLPSRFSVRYGAALMDGDTEVRAATPGVAWAQFECTDTPATWGWTLVERTDRGARLTVLIPPGDDDVPLTELEQIDPDSFDPVAPPDPAWLPAIAAETTRAESAESALSDALGLETTARQNADTLEATTRGNADTALDGRVTPIESALAGRLSDATLSATYGSFVNLAKNPDAIITGAVTRKSNGVVTSAAVVWPNGQPGTFTTDTIGSLNTIDGYHITYGSPVTRTYTQPTITRDSSGAATNVPAIVVS